MVGIILVAGVIAIKTKTDRNSYMHGYLIVSILSPNQYA